MNPRHNRYYALVAPLLRDRRMQLYSSVVLSFLLSTILVIFAILPTWDNIVTLKKELEQNQKTYKDLKSKLESLEEGIKNYAAIPESQKEAAASLIPQAPEITKIVRLLYSLAATNKLSIQGLQIQPIDLITTPTKAKQPNFKEVEFTINLVGDYQQNVAFIDNLIHTSRLFSIKNISIGKQESGKLLTSITAVGYIQY